MCKLALLLPLLLWSLFQPPAPARFEPTLIQGRITALRDSLADVKTPDLYPGDQGRHAMYVRAGRVFRVNVLNARVLLSDGQQSDLKPLAVGDQVVVLLSTPDSRPSVTPRTPPEIYLASIIERQAGTGNAATR